MWREEICMSVRRRGSHLMYRWWCYLQQNGWDVRKRTYQSDVQDTGERDVTVRQVREGSLYVMRARGRGMSDRR
jgi:hypothetical protein